MCLAFSSSAFRAAVSPRPPRLMKYWIMLIPEPIPFGLTRRLPSDRAIVFASFVKTPAGGNVETVFTRRTQRRGFALCVAMTTD